MSPSKAYSKIKFTNMKKIPRVLDDYKEIHTLIVKGQINATYFGIPSKPNEEPQVPATILTNEGAEFNSLTVHAVLEDGQVVAKVFSDKYLDDGAMSRLFTNVTWLHRKSWKAAYPTMAPREFFDGVELDENFYYVNSFEPFISVGWSLCSYTVLIKFADMFLLLPRFQQTMETETVSAKNIVRLLVEKWKKN